MSRYIDADIVLGKMRSTFDMQDLYLPIHFKELIIDEIPTADVKEVVKCKECVGFHNGIFKNNTHKKFCSIRFTLQGEKFVPLIVTENDYCSYGVRREDERSM